MWWAIVSGGEVPAIEHLYESDTQVEFAGEWGCMTHIQIPENLDPTCVMAISDPELRFQIDPVRVATKNAQFCTNIREKRNSLLSQSDWTQMPDVNMSQDRKQAWVEYRQALRDLPALDSVVWPSVPV